MSFQSIQKFSKVATRTGVGNPPILRTDASPLDEEWIQRLKEEYHCLIHYVKMGKELGNDWFRLDSNRGSTVLKPGTRWFGKCWHFQDLKKYEFDFEFDIPETYPMTAPEIALPELDGKTDKIHRGGKIYMTEHFQTLWRRNAPRFGIAHVMALGLGPWLNIEIPEMIEKGVVT